MMAILFPDPVVLSSTQGDPMSFKSFLKSAEEKVANVFKGAAKAEPSLAGIADAAAVAAGFPEVVPFINRIGGLLVSAGGIITAIQGVNGSGAAKLAVAAPMVDTLLRNSGFLSDKAIADEQKWSAAVTQIASSFADLLNAVKSNAPDQPAVPSK